MNYVRDDEIRLAKSCLVLPAMQDQYFF